jgi:hypothetical protein
VTSARPARTPTRAAREPARPKRTIFDGGRILGARRALIVRSRIEELTMAAKKTAKKKSAKKAAKKVTVAYVLKEVRKLPHELHDLLLEEIAKIKPTVRGFLGKAKKVAKKRVARKAK